ncbi:MAG: HIT family protein [Comamonas sp.]
MDYNPDNIFARILRGEAPCVKVYEDAATLAFMDVMPQAEGHVLVIPKEPAVSLLELSEAGAQAAIATVRKLAPAVKQATGADGIFVGQFNGAAAGQTVPHIHFHIIPRHAGQTPRPHATQMADAADLARVAQTIRASLG